MTSSLTPHTAPSISRHEHERPLTESHHDLHAQTFRWSRDSPLVDLVSDSSFSSSQSATPLVSTFPSSDPSTPPVNLVLSDSDATSASIIPSLTVTVTDPLPSLTPLAASIHPAVTTTLSDFQVNTVCIGHGVDAQSIGLLSTLVIPSVVGVAVWVSRLHLFWCRRPS